jgi:hypothetical protein
MILLEPLAAYRARTFRTLPGQHLKSKDDAIEYVNQRGFIYFWPIKEMLFPSLWFAVAGDRPVAGDHDDPGHVTWGWKDSLLGARVGYFAKVFRKRATIIALDVLPYFYALSENYGSPEEDYLTLYEQGRMTLESKALFEALLKEGPLDTISLRKAARLTSRDSDGRFNKALTDLQVDFKILPVGVTDAGAWHYAFAYDLVHRHYPDLINQTRFISDNQARQKLVAIYFNAVGAAQMKDLTKLFGWPEGQVKQAVNALVQQGHLLCDQKMEKHSGTWLALTSLA